ncbi:MAG: hypothetical protein Q4A46_03475 [Clostridia bacterium]|nr:hypothetical protein [Clostridia bacterium]
MQLYDMHTHILPDFDDGSDSVEESLKMIDCLKKQNIKNICFTPHFYTNEMSVEKFVELRNEAYERFLPHKPDGVNIVLGAEVYVSNYLFSNVDLSDITYGKSRYILTEFAYSSSFSDRTLDQIYKLIENYDLKPVLPHVERYETLMHHPDMISELRNIGMLIQTNIGNYADKAPFFNKRKLIKYINEGLIDILGSDTHSMTHRSPECYTQAIDCISQKCGRQKVKEMMNIAKLIFDSAMGED